MPIVLLCNNTTEKNCKAKAYYLYILLVHITCTYYLYIVKQ